MPHASAGEGDELFGYTEQQAAADVMRADAIHMRAVDVGFVTDAHGE